MYDFFFMWGIRLFCNIIQITLYQLTLTFLDHWKTLWEDEKMLITSISLSTIFTISFKDKNHYISNIQFATCTFKLVQPKILFHLEKIELVQISIYAITFYLKTKISALPKLEALPYGKFNEAQMMNLY